MGINLDWYSKTGKGETFTMNKVLPTTWSRVSKLMYLHEKQRKYSHNRISRTIERVGKEEIQYLSWLTYEQSFIEMHGMTIAKYLKKEAMKVGKYLI